MAVVINSTTGEIDLDQTTPGIYVVTYTVQGVSSTQEVTVNAVDDATFSYSASSYEPTDADPTPTITGLTGGTFSGTTGLVINSTTGEIDLSASTAASHTVTYNTSSSGSSVCPNTSTQTVEIAAAGIANNYSMNFDGVNDYLTSINQPALDGQSAISVSLWFNYDSVGDVIMCNSIGWYIHLTSATNLDYYNGSSNNITVSTSANTWYHLGIVHNGTSLEVWLNGTSLGTTTVSTPKNNIGQNLTIGAYRYTNGTFGYYWDGKLDEVAIWNTALTSTQVSEIYNGTGTNLTKDLTTVSGSNLKYWNRMGD